MHEGMGLLGEAPSARHAPVRVNSCGDYEFVERF